MQTTFTLLKNKAVATHGEYANCASPVLHASDADDFRSSMSRLLDEVCVAELVLRERINVRDGLAPQTLGQELNFVALDVLDDENIEPLEEGERDVVDGVAEDGLLNEEDVAVRLLDLLAHVEKVLPALLDNLVHLPVVVDHDRVVHLRRTCKTRADRLDERYVRRVSVRSAGTG